MTKRILIVVSVIALIAVILSVGFASPYIISTDEISISEATVEKISINTATKLELMRIPDIGETTAEKIISYREEHGKYNSLDEIMNLKGIGEGKYKKLINYLKL